MSVTIRLAKVGRKKAPTYKIVVSNTRDKRNGRYLEILGYYNPVTQPAEYELNEDRFEYWKSVGALVSDAVVELKEGTYEYKPYNPNAKDDDKEDSSDNETKDENEGETQEEENEASKEETDEKEKDDDSSDSEN